MTAPDASPLDRLLEHRAWVRGLVRSLVADRARADDVEQQVWLTAIRQPASRIEKPRPWLAEVARNWIRRDLRSGVRRTRREAAAARPETAPPEEDAVERAEAHRAVVDAVLRLPQPLRLAVLLHYFDGLPIAQAADRLRVPHETLRSRLRLARERLRRELGPAADAGTAAWSPALLAIAGLPRHVPTGLVETASLVPASTAPFGGTIAMASNKLVLALVLPLAIGAAWFTAKAAAPPREVPDRDEMDRLHARLERLERSLETSRGAAPVQREDRTLRARVDAIESRLQGAASPPSAAGGAPDVKPVGTRAEGASFATPIDARAAEMSKEGSAKLAERDMELAMRKKMVDLKTAEEAAVYGLKGEPGSPEHRAAIRKMAEAMASDPAANQTAGRLLDGEARGGRISPVEADDVVGILDGTQPGNAARASLAGVVAAGWSKEERLGGFLGRFPCNAEPAVHQSLLGALERSSSAAHGDYVLRIVREERDQGIVGYALRAERIETVARPDVAGRFAQTIETRLQDGSLDPKVRLVGGLATAVACLHEPDVGAATLRRMAERENTGFIANFQRRAAAALADRTATARSLERLVKESK